jgi:long-subunit acyl-CoA synthetase (AMP-forming)
VWEKFKDKIEAGVRDASGLKEVIFEKARVSVYNPVSGSHHWL